MKSRRSWLLTALVLAYLLYAHWRDQPSGEFAAFVSSFEGADDDTGDGQRPDVLGFVYPQEDAAYAKGPYPHERFLYGV